MRIDFYMGPEFLRTKQKTNPFFDPIIKVCEENGIEWRVLFPGKPKVCGYPVDKVASFGFWQIGSVWFWRVVHLFWHVPTWRINHLYGRILGWFGFLKCDFAITIAGWGASEVGGANPNARIADIQHGVVYSRHSGYFDGEGRLLPIYRNMKNREFWVYGQGFVDCFFKNPDNAKDLQGRVKVIGDVVRAGKELIRVERIENRDLIVVASQMTTDFDVKILREMKGIYEEFFVKVNNYGRVVFRHHPRFGDCIDLSDWEQRFPWLIMDDTRSWSEVFKESLCLVTINSTVVFDAAASGVPTVLLDGFSEDLSKIMANEYRYPCTELTISDIIKMQKEDRMEIGNQVYNWYLKYYKSFSDEDCFKLITTTLDKGV